MEKSATRTAVEIAPGMGDLSGQEFRILVLSLDPADHPDEIARSLDVSPDVVLRLRAGVRQKLRIAEEETIAAFVGRTPALRHLIEDESPALLAFPRAGSRRARVLDRREKHLLRKALRDVQALEAAVRRQAIGLERFLGVAGIEESFLAADEAVSLRLLAGDLAEMTERTLRRERQWHVSG